MKPGKEYENFVFRIFSEYFREFSLKQNEKIIGNESGILREIDISIRGKVEDVDLLFIVQAKDYGNHKADINTIGTFSSVIKDIGASKGFLVCSSGFAKSNSAYAKTLGIELLSVEDIESNKWKATIGIPVIYIYYNLFYTLNHTAPGNLMMQLFKLDNNFSLLPEDQKNFSIDDGKTFLHVNEHIAKIINQKKISLMEKQEIIFKDVCLFKYQKFKFPLSTLTITPEKRTFLKYILPNEYRGIRDHLNETFIPTTIKISDISFHLDDSFIPIDEKSAPVNPAGYSITIEAVMIN